jgi:hypothetical protein
MNNEKKNTVEQPKPKKGLVKKPVRTSVRAGIIIGI